MLSRLSTLPLVGGVRQAEAPGATCHACSVAKPAVWYLLLRRRCHTKGRSLQRRCLLSPLRLQKSRCHGMVSPSGMRRPQDWWAGKWCVPLLVSSTVGATFHELGAT